MKGSIQSEIARLQVEDRISKAAARRAAPAKTLRVPPALVVVITLVALIAVATPASASVSDSARIDTVAGNGDTGLSGDGGPATSARLSRPVSVIAAPGGGFYVADENADVVRRVGPNGRISRIAGTGEPGAGGDGGPATEARLNAPRGLALDHDGNLLIADTGNNRIRLVTPGGDISAYAGTGAPGYSGDGGEATAARLCAPNDVAVAIDGSVLVADSCNHRVRRITSDGTIGTIAGNGGPGASGDGGLATSAEVGTIQAIAAAPDGGYVIVDPDHNRVRRVTAGQITTIAGTGAQGFSGDGGPAAQAVLGYPQNVDVTADNVVIVTDTGNARIRAIAPDGLITTVAGSGQGGYSGDGGPADRAELQGPSDATSTPTGELLVADAFNHRVRRVEAPALPGSTFVVNSTADTDDHRCEGSPGDCTLREAIEQANSDNNPLRTDRITFSIGLGGVQTISANALPILAEPTLIDGGTQPGRDPADRPAIEIDAGGSRLLNIDAPSSIRDLAITNADTGVALLDRAAGSSVRGSFFGMTPAGLSKPNHISIELDAAGTTIAGNRIGTTSTGTQIQPAVAVKVTRPGSTVGPDNVIAGQIDAGIRTFSGTTITGNRIGTDPDGRVAVPNGYGVDVVGDHNLITRNLISGNDADGVRIRGEFTYANTVRGNQIGTTVDGLTALGNAYSGVRIEDGAFSNTVGGNSAGDGNLISGNGRGGDFASAPGILVASTSPGANVIAGNVIGLKVDGRQALGNESEGVFLDGRGNRVGGTDPGKGNVISGNGDAGVRVNGDGTTVVGNKIGTNLAGNAAIGNNTAGIAIAASGNTIGDGTSGGRNVVSGNLNEGIWIGNGAAGNAVRGNYIGTDDDGLHDLGNGQIGISFVGGGSAPGDAPNVIGGGAPGDGNLIAASGVINVFVTDAPSTVVRGNDIGTNRDRTAPLGDPFAGVWVSDSEGVEIGGSGGGEGNVIGGGEWGVAVTGTSPGTTIRGNSIGVGADGAAVATRSGGVVFNDTGGMHTVGGVGAGEGNTIANTGGTGVRVDGLDSRVAIRGNSIYSNADLGVDLVPVGATPNDEGDVDEGPNGLQNAPSLNDATSSGGATAVTGTLSSKPNAEYDVDLYSSDDCGSNGNGQGRRLERSVSVTTDGNGHAEVGATLSGVRAGDVVTATATAGDGSTSEFSDCVTVAAVPDASLDDAAVGEADGVAHVPVRLSRASGQPVTVAYRTRDDSAVAGSDYTESSGTVTFAPGEVVKSVVVPVASDALDEPDEQFVVSLSEPAGATIGDGSARVTVADDDAEPDLSVADASAVEAAGELRFEVTLSAPSGKSVTTDAATAAAAAGGPAADTPGDYAAQRATLTFAPGETSKQVVVPVVDDSAHESDERFAVELSAPVHAGVARGSAVGTIVDDDPESAAPAPVPTPAAPGQQQPAAPRDTKAPRLKLGRVSRKLTRSVLLRRGLSFSVASDEPARIDVQLVARGRVLARAKRSAVEGAQKLKLKLSRAARRRLANERQKLTLLVAATDAAGNTRRVTRTVTIGPSA